MGMPFTPPISKAARLDIKSDEFQDIFEIDEKGVARFKCFVCGDWVEGDEWIDVKSCIDLSTIAKVPKLSEECVERALGTLYTYGRWDARNLPGYKRLAILRKLADLIEQNRQQFINTLILDAGKPVVSAKAEVDASIERLRISELDVKKIQGEFVPGDWSDETTETEALVRREPVGVVLAIVPFNYPLLDSVNKFTYSFLSGNAVALKPASSDPISTILLSKLIELAGVPKRSFALLTLRGSEMGKVVSDRRISAITLTGSTETGISVVRQAGIKQFLMELGGGDCAIVMHDADTEWAAKRIARGVYSYSGQRCDAIKLILVEEEVYEKLRRRLVEELSKVKVGDPRDESVDVGPLIEPSAADTMMHAIEDAVKKGGSVIVGGKRLGPTYVEPTLVEIPKALVRQTELYQKEIFAPVALLVGVRGVEEAVEFANARSYGLDAAIFGRDIFKLRYAMRHLEVGTVYINDYPRHGIGYYPFGGRKNSGIGREGLGYSIEYISAPKTIVYNYKGSGVWEYL